jgi:hypothetical protein
MPYLRLHREKPYRAAATLLFLEKRTTICGKERERMSFCKTALACCAFLLALQSAWGAPRESQERAARKACLLGDVAKGTEILADLYLDTKDATFIYNQGRCYEQNGQNEQAILRFREYLRTAQQLPAADVAVVQKKIAELEEKDKARNASPAGPPPFPTPAASAAGQPAATAATDPLLPLQLTQPAPAPAAATSAPMYKRWWFWTGVGGVVAGAVATTLVLTSGSGAKHSPACSPSGVTCVP